MSVLIVNEKHYYQIGKTLNLKYDFINSLYTANQKAYDITYNKIQEIDHLNKLYFENNDLTKYDQKELNLKLRSIRYNIYPNDSDPIIDSKDLLHLDYLIQLTDQQMEIELK